MSKMTDKRYCANCKIFMFTLDKNDEDSIYLCLKCEDLNIIWVK